MSWPPNPWRFSPNPTIPGIHPLVECRQTNPCHIRGNLHSLQNSLYLPEPMVSHHRVPSPSKLRRMMCSKPLEVTRPSLTASYINLCNGGKCSAHRLHKCRLIKARWWSATPSWTTSTSAPSTCHLFSFVTLVVHNAKH